MTDGPPITVAAGSKTLGDWVRKRQRDRVKLSLAYLEGDMMLAELVANHAVTMAGDMPGRDPAMAAGAAKALMEFIILYGYELGRKHAEAGVSLDQFELPEEISEELTKAEAMYDGVIRRAKSARANRDRDVA